jgi:hypothetical protein
MFVLAFVSFSMRWRGFRATQSFLQKLLSLKPAESVSVPATERSALTAHLVNSADRHGFVHPSCLAKSLTLWWLLERQGIASHLRIGVRKEKEKFEAHACGGVAVNEPEDYHRHYAVFDAAFSSWPPEEQ